MQRTGVSTASGLFAAGAGILALLPGACAEGSDAEEQDQAVTAKADAKAGGPVYLVASAFFNADDVETYLVTTDRFDAQTEVEPSKGIKVLGEAVPIVHGGSVYIADSRAPVITRYDLNAAGTLVKHEELSFAGVGINEIVSWFVYIASDEKGYVFDPAGPRLVAWNPKTMTLTGTEIDLGMLSRDGFVPRLALEVFSPRRRGDELLIPVAWTGQDEEYRHAAGLLVLDTRRDEVLAAAEDERCGEAYMTLQDATGDVYFFPSATSSEQNFYADERGASCALRVRAGERGFDPAYQLDLSALAGGQAAAGAVPDGKGGFFFGGVDRDLRDAPDQSDGLFWRVYHSDMRGTQVREVSALPVWAGALYYADVGGEFYLPHWRDDGDAARTTLYRIDGSADPKELFGFDASWSGFGRLR